MLHFHKWIRLAENNRWKLEECSKCGVKRWNENYLAPYQSKPKVFEVKKKNFNCEVF